MDKAKEKIRELMHEMYLDICAIEENEDTHDAKKTWICQMAKRAYYEKSITAFISYVNELDDFLGNKLCFDSRFCDELSIIGENLHKLYNLIDNYFNQEEENGQKR